MVCWKPRVFGYGYLSLEWKFYLELFVTSCSPTF
jgi:hypothetical protein